QAGGPPGAAARRRSAGSSDAPAAEVDVLDPEGGVAFAAQAEAGDLRRLQAAQIGDRVDEEAGLGKALLVVAAVAAQVVLLAVEAQAGARVGDPRVFQRLLQPAVDRAHQDRPAARPQHAPDLP